MPENVVDVSTEIRLGGQNLILRYRAFAFIEYAAKCGGDLLRDVRALGTGLEAFGKLAESGEVGEVGPLFGQIRDILWAGLIDAQPSITRDDVARLFTLQDFEPIAVAIGAGLRGGLPEAPKRRPTKPAPTTGRRRPLQSINGVGSGPASATQAESDSPNLPG